MGQKRLHIFKETLAGIGLKVTQQRLVIYEALVEAENHPTAEEVYEKTKKRNPSISLGTVYKTLEIFVNKRLINRVNTPKGNMRYDGIIENHNHIYFRNTNEIMDFKDDHLAELIVNYLKGRKITNFNIKDIRLHITGDKIDPEKKVVFE